MSFHPCYRKLIPLDGCAPRLTLPLFFFCHRSINLCQHSLDSYLKNLSARRRFRVSVHLLLLAQHLSPPPLAPRSTLAQAYFRTLNDMITLTGSSQFFLIFLMPPGVTFVPGLAPMSGYHHHTDTRPVPSQAPQTVTSRRCFTRIFHKVFFRNVLDRSVNNSPGLLMN